MAVEILCIGHAAFDVSLFVEEFPEENGKSEIGTLTEMGGGPAANAAYLLSLWKVASAFAGVVGDDRYGHQLCAEFDSVGTNISLLERRSGYDTPFSVIIVNRQNGSRTIINRKAASFPLRLNSAATQPLAPKILLFDGHELEASLQALQLFPDALSILDAGSLREGTRQLAGKVDYLAASERFALQITGLPDLETDESRKECLGLLAKMFSPTALIVTLGEQGLIALGEKGFSAMPAFPATVVDTTAAGDVFHGALAYAVLKELSLPKALRLASMAAALSVRIPGGRKSIPRLDQVEKALEHAE